MTIVICDNWIKGSWDATRTGFLLTVLSYLPSMMCPVCCISRVVEQPLKRVLSLSRFGWAASVQLFLEEGNARAPSTPIHGHHHHHRLQMTSLPVGLLFWRLWHFRNVSKKTFLCSSVASIVTVTCCKVLFPS